VGAGAPRDGMSVQSMPSSPPSGLVHGMGHELAEADWPGLTDGEVREVLDHFEVSRLATTDDVKVTWQSPRPMSAASLVRVAGGEVFVKRHHVTLRSVERLRVEHELASFVRARGQSLPRVLNSTNGDTVHCDGDFVYEVQERAVGVDLYREVPSWYPFMSLAHARAAGQALAEFHRAAEDFTLEPTPPGILTDSIQIITAENPLAEIERLVATRPGLARALAKREWREDFERYLLSDIEIAAALLRSLPAQWGHGDWHPSNLTWGTTALDAAVAGVFDLGLSNRTSVVHDLAVALERSTIDWLDLAGTGVARANIEAVDALLDGYEEVHPLSESELAALVAELPVVHVEFALSEVEYFADVVKSPSNADLAYDGYFVGHARWFEEEAGRALTNHLRRRAVQR
jgi:Ser/Thr protein kinase RdoA (MazF antagonist)